MKPFTLIWTIELQDEGKLVRQFLKEREISKAALTDIKFGGGSITVNSNEMTVRYVLKKGDLLRVVYPPEMPSLGILKEDIPFEIVYEDDYLLVINKSAYMATIPSREHPTGTLANAILHYYEVQGIACTIHIVNRLDRDTSGLLIVAKHRFTHHLFSKQQKVASIKRRYEAFVHGHLFPERGTIDAPIGRREDSIIAREVREDGQPAVTHYFVLTGYDEFTHVSLKLETGRTHQIRVHLAYLAHPLLGDDLYGGKRNLMARQALHSCELSFVHPISGENLTFTAGLPDDMKKVIEKEG
ncbi:RluA family pseudouridine synthase [Bacillus sp. DJP31]|uniref:RluA family pseudouridine synthase n=1 Tax=Bacillus sp. DJP31 TaxID=3409789 RepID=UPI003BB52EC1